MSSNYFTIANARDKLINTFTLPINAKSTQTRNFTIGPLVSTPTWVKIAFVTSGSGGSVKGSLVIDGLITGLSTGNTFVAKIDFDTTSATRKFSANVAYTKGAASTDFFAASGRGFDIAVYVDSAANAHIYAKAYAANITCHLNCVLNMPVSGVMKIYQPSDVVLSLAAISTNAQLLAADSTIVDVVAVFSMNTSAQFVAVDASGNISTSGSNLSLNGGYNAEPSGVFLTGSNSGYNILNLDVNNADVARRLVANVGAGFSINDANQISNSNALFQWYYRPATQTVETQIARLDSSGTLILNSNLGVGFTSASTLPSARAHIIGANSRTAALTVEGKQPGLLLANTDASSWNMWVANANAGYGVLDAAAQSGTLMFANSGANSSAFVIQPDTGFVGIGLGSSNPLVALDVNGDIIGRGTAATIAGTTQFKTYVKTLTTGINDYTNICSLQASGGAFTFSMDIVQSESAVGASISKTYFVTTSQQSTNNSYYRLLPLYSSSVGNDWAVEINMSGTTAVLRLVRIATGGIGTTNGFNVNFTIRQSRANSVTIVDLNATGIGLAMNYGIYANTQITQCGSNVGIGTSNPTATLHVAGDLRIDSNVIIQNPLQIRGMRFLPKSGLSSSAVVNVINPTQDYYVTSNADVSFFRYWAGGVEIARITGTGKLGIGTSNPTAALHVNGSAIVSNAYWGYWTGAVSTTPTFVTYSNCRINLSSTIGSNIGLSTTACTANYFTPPVTGLWQVTLNYTNAATTNNGYFMMYNFANNINATNMIYPVINSANTIQTCTLSGILAAGSNFALTYYFGSAGSGQGQVTMYGVTTMMVQRTG